MHEDAISSSKQGIYVPQCKSDGGFEAVQCYGPSNECWCVDQEGSELNGTRRKGTLKCTGLGLFNVCYCCYCYCSFMLYVVIVAINHWTKIALRVNYIRIQRVEEIWRM